MTNDDYMQTNPMSGNFRDTSPEAQRLRRERGYFHEAQGITPSLDIELGAASLEPVEISGLKYKLRHWFGPGVTPTREGRPNLIRALRFVLDELHRTDELPPE